MQHKIIVLKLGKMYNKNSRTVKQSCCNISGLELKFLFDQSNEEEGELVFNVAVFEQDTEREDWRDNIGAALHL